MGLIHPVSFLGSPPPATDQSIEFDADAQYCYDTSPTGCDFTGTFTLETWAKFASLPAAGTEAWLLRRWDFGNNEGWYLAVENIFSTYSLRLHYGDGLANRELIKTFSPSTDTWYHFAGAYYFDDVLDRNWGYLTIDGVEVYQGYISSSLQMVVPTGEDLEVNHFSSSFKLLGKMAESRIWSTRRTKTQIDDNKGVRKTGAEAGLVTVLPWSGVATDAVGSNDMTLAGSPGYSTDSPF